METASASPAETWNLADLYADDDAFEAAAAELGDRVGGLDRWRGRLAEGPEVLAEALEEVHDSWRALARLRCYASLKSDGDTRVARYQAMRQRVELLGTDVSTRVSWLEPELLTLDPSRVEANLAREPRLGPYAFYLRELLRRRAHVLGPAEERILSHAGLLTGAPSSLYSLLNNADLPRREIALADGTALRVTPVAFHTHRGSQNRDERRALFHAYFDSYAAMRETLGANLYAGLKAHLFRARSRNYPSCLAAALDADHVPETVVRNLIRQVRERLPVLHRYCRARARALSLERLAYHDLYCPLLPTPPRRYPPAEARRLVADSLAPLGPGYVAALDRAFANRWIDWHPAPGKRSGAYATGWAYDVHPYVLTNFTGDYEGVSTLAHEMGHAMHSWYSNRAQPFATADYSIFVAEVASTLNEALLSRHMLEHAVDPRERAFLLASWLDGMRGTLFRQTMFAEFELDVHERTERGEALTGERLSEIYLELLRSWHGHDEGVVEIDEVSAMEWAAVPHFYYDFYVYQYATGVVAATALAERLVDEGAPAAERYRQFLESGGSDHPLDLLRRAGVDLEAAEPYEAAMAAIDRRIDDLESLLDAP